MLMFILNLRENWREYKLQIGCFFAALLLIIIIASASSRASADSYERVEGSERYDGIFEDLNLLHKVHKSNVAHPMVIKFNDGLTFYTPGFRLDAENLKDVASKPQEIHINHRREDQIYSLLMVDPDAPTRENNIDSPWLHWLEVNLEGNTSDAKFLKTGATIVDYIPPTPPKNTKWHRYTILVFVQDKALSVSEVKHLREFYQKITDHADFRKNFDIEEFLGKVPGKLKGVQMFKAENVVQGNQEN